METLIFPREASGPTAAAPRWVMLNREIQKHSRSSAAGAETKTTAASCTSTGLPFSVSLSIAAPPERSSFHYDLLVDSTPSSDHHKGTRGLELNVIAAHDDCVLIEARVPAAPERYYYRHYPLFKLDYFLYEAGGGGRTPPTLSLLPDCHISNQFHRDKHAPEVPTRTHRQRNLSIFKDTGILRRGEGGEILLAQLEVECFAPYSPAAELCVLRLGHDDWVLRRVPREGKLVQHWTVVDATVPVGNRFMCWVNYRNGFRLCDMAEEENPKLLYVPLPVSSSPTEMCHRRSERRLLDMQYCRKLADAGNGAVRFVSVAPRCCGGGSGKKSCERSSFAFNVTTWTLALRTEEPMAWVKDSVLDCDELWQLPNYGRLPRVAPQYPIVSSDDPDIVYFTVCENHYLIKDADKTVWMVEINTRTKAVLSVVRSDTEDYMAPDFVPAKLHW